MIVLVSWLVACRTPSVPPEPLMCGATALSAGVYSFSHSADGSVREIEAEAECCRDAAVTCEWNSGGISTGSITLAPLGEAPGAGHAGTPMLVFVEHVSTESAVVIAGSAQFVDPFEPRPKLQNTTAEWPLDCETIERRFGPSTEYCQSLRSGGVPHPRLECLEDDTLSAFQSRALVPDGVGTVAMAISPNAGVPRAVEAIRAAGALHRPLSIRVEERPSGIERCTTDVDAFFQGAIDEHVILAGRRRECANTDPKTALAAHVTLQSVSGVSHDFDLRFECGLCNESPALPLQIFGTIEMDRFGEQAHFASDPPDDDLFDCIQAEIAASQSRGPGPRSEERWSVVVRVDAARDGGTP